MKKDKNIRYCAECGKAQDIEQFPLLTIRDFRSIYCLNCRRKFFKSFENINYEK